MTQRSALERLPATDERSPQPLRRIIQLGPDHHRGIGGIESVIRTYLDILTGTGYMKGTPTITLPRGRSRRWISLQKTSGYGRCSRTSVATIESYRSAGSSSGRPRSA